MCGVPIVRISDLVCAEGHQFETLEERDAHDCPEETP